MMIRVIYLIIVTVILASCANYGRPPIPSQESHNQNLTPSIVSTQAKKSKKSRGKNGKNSRDVVIEYKGYQVSYNQDAKIPIWVFYELLDFETDGPYTRKHKQFCQDPNFDGIQADDQDYKNSGWSRGHMAPAGDFKWSDEAMSETFYYTNCCPQDKSLNSGQWNSLEKRVRSWANQFGRLQVYTGPIVKDNKNGRIGLNRVVVPDAFFKALATDKQTIAIVMYNHNNNKHLQNCVLTVDELENLTGIDFSWGFDKEFEKQIESKYSLDYWGLN